MTREEKGVRGRAKDVAKVRKAMPQITCALTDVRVWIMSPQSPNRCGLMVYEERRQEGRFAH